MVSSVNFTVIKEPKVPIECTCEHGVFGTFEARFPVILDGYYSIKLMRRAFELMRRRGRAAQ